MFKRTLAYILGSGLVNSRDLLRNPEDNSLLLCKHCAHYLPLEEALRKETPEDNCWCEVTPGQVSENDLACGEFKLP